MKKHWKTIGGILGLALVPGGLVGLGLYWLLTLCHHRYSRPFSTRSLDAKQSKYMGHGSYIVWSDNNDRPVETYVVCLECGKEFNYDLETMKVGKRREIKYEQLQ
jgi:hypothetical protein